MDKTEESKLAAQRAIFGHSQRDLKERPERFEFKEIKKIDPDLEKAFRDPVISKKLQADLVAIKAGLLSEEEVEAFKEEYKKEKARQRQSSIVAKRKQKLAELEKEVRSDRTLSKLEKMLQIRAIQRQRANL